MTPFAATLLATMYLVSLAALLVGFREAQVQRSAGTAIVTTCSTFAMHGFIVWALLQV